MAEITVTELGPKLFKVEIEEQGTTSEHRVTVAPDDLEGLPRDSSTSALVEASFRFLLDREPKESILREFELGVISRYFPEYREEVACYL